MPETAVRCHNLQKAFGEQSVLEHVTFTIATGQILALLGPSGCGKTTTLRLIAGFERLDSGWIEIAGQLVADERTFVAPEKRRVGMVFQDYAIFPHLSVASNIAFGLGRRRDSDERVEAMLELVGLAGLGDQMPHELSGGQQQRVALARALVMEPAVLLMDEPFSNLDSSLRIQVRAEVRDLLKAGGATALFVTHDQEEALFIGDRVGVMNAGRLEQLGTPEEIYHRPRTRFVAEFIGRSDFVAGCVTDAGVETPLGLVAQAVNAPAGSPVEIAVRPDDVLLTVAGDEGNGRILSRHFVGIANVYEVALADGTVLHSWQPHGVQLPAGSPVLVTIDGSHPLPCFFAGKAV
jgi:iron(III) transport system ATP-binding protein